MLFHVSWCKWTHEAEQNIAKLIREMDQLKAIASNNMFFERFASKTQSKQGNLSHMSYVLPPPRSCVRVF